MQSLEPPEAQARLQSEPAPLLLDVRMPDEFRGGHIAGARLIPLPELEQRLSELPRDREILCVCAGGMRSSSAVRLLLKSGYRAVNLSGGMSAWSRAGLPVQKATRGA